MKSITNALRRARRESGIDTAEDSLTERLAGQDINRKPLPFDEPPPRREPVTEVASTSELPAVNPQVHLRDYLHLLLRRRWLILVVSLTVPTAAGIQASRREPLYQSNALLQINQGRVRFVQEAVGGTETAAEFYGTHRRILESRAMVRRAVTALELWSHPEFGRGYSPNDTPPPEVVEEYTNWAKSMVSTFHVPGTQLIDVTITSPKPQLSALLANSLVRQYIDFTKERESGVARNAASFLHDQIVKLEAEIADMESRLEERQASETDRTLPTQRLETRSAQLMNAEAERTSARIRYERLLNGDPMELPEVVEHETVRGIRRQYEALQAEHAQLSTRFKSDWPDVQRVRKEMDEARRRLDEALSTVRQELVVAARSDYETVLARENRLRQDFEREKRVVQSFETAWAEYDRAALETNSKKALLQDLRRRQNEAGLSADLGEQPPVNAAIIEEARPPGGPSNMNVSRTVAVGTFAGIVLGIGLALFIEYWNTTIITVEDLRRHVPVRYLGTIPRYQGRGRASRWKILGEADSTASDTAVLHAIPGHPDPASSDEQFALDESFKFVRMMLLANERSSSTVAIVTSPEQGAGKTFVASNLAISLSRIGKKVLLIDADLRLPSLHEIFGINNEIGLSSILDGEAELGAGFFQETGVDHLYVLSAGPMEETSSEHLESGPIRETLVVCRQQFDYVVIDSAPLLPVPDTVSLAQYCDEVILVVRSGRTSRDAVQNSLDLFSRAKRKVTGVVLNDVNFSELSNAYYQSYRKYGYSRHRGAGGA